MVPPLIPTAPVQKARDAAGAEPRRPGHAGPRRLPQLDGLRGLAAAVVVLHHAMLSMPGGATTDGAVAALGTILLLGRPAVVLFFVLSGFVLTLHLTTRTEGLVAFAARRVARLMPPYWAAIAGAYVLFCLTPGGRAAGLSPWFTEQWGIPVSPADVLLHLAMLAGPRQFPLDHVAWSLVHELRLSLVLPLLVVVATNLGSSVILVIGALVTLGAEVVVAARPELFPAGVYGFRFDAPGLGPSFVLTCRFALDFSLGAVLALNRGWVGAALARRTWLRPVTLVVAFALLSGRHETIMAVGAGLLIILAVSWPRFARALDATPAAWLGRVSYSLYLVHLPVMLACGSALSGFASAPVGLAVGALLSFLCAEVFCRFVEMPSIRWSRAVGRAVAVRGAPPPVTLTLLRTDMTADWAGFVVMRRGRPAALVVTKRAAWGRGLRCGGAAIFAGIAATACGGYAWLLGGDPHHERVLGVELLTREARVVEPSSQSWDAAFAWSPFPEAAPLPLLAAMSFASPPYGWPMLASALGRKENGGIGMVAPIDTALGTPTTRAPPGRVVEAESKRHTAAERRRQPGGKPEP